MKKSLVTEICAVLLLSMFLYASFSKIFDFKNFEVSMHNQPFPSWLSEALVWTVPPTEIITAGLLIFGKTQRLGLLVSSVLMGLFTLYIVFVLLHLFPNIPCSCGGIIKSFTWFEHLYFNLFFLTTSLIGYIITITKIKLSLKNISRAKSG